MESFDCSTFVNGNEIQGIFEEKLKKLENEIKYLNLKLLKSEETKSKLHNDIHSLIEDIKLERDANYEIRLELWDVRKKRDYDIFKLEEKIRSLESEPKP